MIAEFKARPTTYKGIQMRSRLEATVAAALDEHGFIWQYEPRCFADETRQYLPDFEVLDDRNAHDFWEIKGVCVDPVAVMRRMSVIWRSEPAAGLILAVADGDRRWAGSTMPNRRDVAVWHDQNDRDADLIWIWVPDGSVIPWHHTDTSLHLHLPGSTVECDQVPTHGA